MIDFSVVFHLGFGHNFYQLLTRSSLLEVPGGPKFPPRALKVALRAPFQVFWRYLGPPVRHWDNFWSTFAPYGISFEHFG